MALIFTVVLFLNFDTVLTLDNITVDSTNIDLIHYSGNWTTSVWNNFDYGGTHQWSSDPSTNATFAFTGVGVYYLSSLFNHPVTSQISIDGNPAQFINLTSPVGGGGNQDVPSMVVWGVDQLLNVPHNVVVSMAPGGTYVEVDAFIYTSNTESTASNQPPTTGPSSSTAPASSSTTLGSQESTASSQPPNTGPSSSTASASSSTTLGSQESTTPSQSLHTTSSSSSTGPASASNISGSHTNIGAVVGGTLAGLVVIIAIVLLWKFRKNPESGMRVDARGSNFYSGV
ncbi:hypothetical protein PILCRDRAFT_814719 [Piloderma croceum F 1598]|uniref:Mid2 domain-containing protein n=1 Tax=Piloderma croceum (strain F 1598) TaxID=765440 RepID=A0A0C3GBM6_PILCF|nr:hypothetical protein PILCRDRAFT_814719 [Piloderma croceum F 1598]